MPDTMQFAVCLLGGYLIGSIPVGIIVARLVGKIDIRDHGSKNIGATNVGRTLGRKWGLFVLLLDALKGAIPVLAARHLLAWSPHAPLPPQDIALLSGITAILGHIFPITLGFRGGKGVATSSGVLISVVWLYTLIAFGVWTAIVLTTRYVSLGSIFACITILVSHLVCSESPWQDDLVFTGFSIVLVVAIIYLHHSNIKRILQGTEHKVLQRSDPKDHGAQ